MNSTKTSSRNNNPYNSRMYYKYTLKHNWQQFAFYLIVVFLGMIVPCVIRTSRVDNIPSLNKADFATILVLISEIGFTVSGLMGLFSGMTSLSYVNNKQNITCIHSFPIKRSSIFITETTTGGIYYIFSILLGYLLSYTIISVSANMHSVSFGADELKYLITMIIASVLVFLLVNSTTLLAAGLTGTGIVRLLMTVILMFMPIILYMLVLYTINIGNDNLNAEYYMEEGIIYVLCPVIRLIKVASDDKILLSEILKTTLYILPIVIINYAGAFLLHKYRRTETSGTTIIWKPVFYVTKYVIIFASALLGIIIFGSGIFYYSTGTRNIIDIIFGSVIGLVLSYMAVNCIMYRSVRAVFRDVKPFIAVSAVSLAFALIIPANCFGLLDGMYSISNTKSLTFEYNNAEIVFDDSDPELLNEALEKIDMVYDSDLYDVPYIWSETDSEYLEENFPYYGLDEENSEQYLKYGKYNDEGYVVEPENMMTIYNPMKYITIVQNPKFGIPLAVEKLFPANSELTKLLQNTEAYRDSMNVSKIINEDENRLEEIFINLDSEEFSLSCNGDINVYASGDYGFNYHDKDILWEQAEALIDLCAYDSYMPMDSSIAGDIRFSYTKNDRYYNLSYPIYAQDLELLNSVSSLAASIKNISFTDYNSADEYYEKLYLNYTEAVIVDIETGEAKRIDLDVITEYADKTINEHLMSSSSINRFSELEEAPGYLFLVKNKDTEMLLFRKGKADKTELKALFDSLD